jgi:hypothetical protein
MAHSEFDDLPLRETLIFLWRWQAVSVTELHRLNGFWLVRPDGSKAWPWKYFKAKINQASSGIRKYGAWCHVVII